MNEKAAGAVVKRYIIAGELCRVEIACWPEVDDLVAGSGEDPGIPESYPVDGVGLDVVRPRLRDLDGDVYEIAVSGRETDSPFAVWCAGETVALGVLE